MTIPSKSLGKMIGAILLLLSFCVWIEEATPPYKWDLEDLPAFRAPDDPAVLPGLVRRYMTTGAVEVAKNRGEINEREAYLIIRAIESMEKSREAVE